MFAQPHTHHCGGVCLYRWLKFHVYKGKAKDIILFSISIFSNESERHTLYARPGDSVLLVLTVTWSCDITFHLFILVQWWHCLQSVLSLSLSLQLFMAFIVLNNHACTYIDFFLCYCMLKCECLLNVPTRLFHISWHNKVQSSHKSNIKTLHMHQRKFINEQLRKYLLRKRMDCAAGTGVFVKFSLFFMKLYAKLGWGVARCLVLGWELESYFWQSELISFSFDFFRHTIAETIAVLSNHMTLIWKKMVSIRFHGSWISSRIINTCVWCICTYVVE